ncbi:outer membrane protein assembly factor BamC [Hafnia alvei]|uniref:Outer membrane protein assembly factor BamC n=1 Tax=Hafnia alvei TaxID=569 RepID=A0A1C6Z762_HAFAL|nr:outer membrane protein assembly factor BamC [Hafnia alvei]NLS55377.1 outer membrane protein assembly factor BamC [Hafnia alvei]SCM54956.1 Beta-barrel assembly machine subunit BamC [Hafnia alvei]
MAYLVQKSAVATVVGISLVMMLSACSTDQRYKRQVSGDEAYLDASTLSELKTPAGMILPVQNGAYDVRLNVAQGNVGKALDIRPPAQPLALLNGSRGQFVNGAAIVLVESTPGASSLWSQVAQAVQGLNYPIASRNDAGQTLTTDWINFQRGDEDVQYQGRYQVTVQPQGYQTAVVVKSLGLKQGDTAITEDSQTQRYAVSVLNDIVSGLDKYQTDQANARANRQVGDIDVQSGADDTGLPVLIARAPYTAVWDRLPATLEHIGMKVTDRSRPQGTISVTYKSIGSSSWDDLGAKDPELKEGDYKIQVGDLDNRTSLQFLDSKGAPLSQSQNDALVSVFQAAFAKVKVSQ